MTKFLTGNEWNWRLPRTIAQGVLGVPVANVDTISRANVAAQIMEHLCRCGLHGYSRPGRYGTSGHCTVQTDAGPIKVKKADRDCSSAMCEAWELALLNTSFEGRITRYNWTGSMREAFLSSGLFEWKPLAFNASRGDIYLDEQNHTAMCVQNDASAATYAGEAGVGIVDVEFEGGSLGPNGWFTKNMSGGKLIGLTACYDTPHPGDTGYYEACYRVLWLSSPPAWGKWEHDDNDGGLATMPTSWI